MPDVWAVWKPDKGKWEVYTGSDWTHDVIERIATPYAKNHDGTMMVYNRINNDWELVEGRGPQMPYKQLQFFGVNDV